MATYGEIRFRLSKLAGQRGLDLDLLDGWIQDRYLEILDVLSWKRLDMRGTLQTAAEYSTGTVTATNGSDSITGDGTTWTAGMTGRMIRIGSGPEFYGFTFGSATAATLDRNYEGEDVAGASYQINQNVYSLPVDLRILDGIESFELAVGLERKSLAQLNQMAPRRSTYGAPEIFALYMDQVSDPPQPQIELYPVPYEAQGFTYDYTADAAAPTTASTTILPWMRPAALIAGVQADINAQAGDRTGADFMERRFASLVQQMARIDMARVGPTRLRMAASYTRHRVRRWLR